VETKITDNELETKFQVRVLLDLLIQVLYKFMNISLYSWLI